MDNVKEIVHIYVTIQKGEYCWENVELFVYLGCHGWLQDLSTVLLACEGRCVARFVGGVEDWICTPVVSGSYEPTFGRWRSYFFVDI